MAKCALGQKSGQYKCLDSRKNIFLLDLQHSHEAIKDMSDRLVTEHDAGLLCSDYLLLINYTVLKTDVDCIAVICSRAITLATLLQLLLLLHYWLHRKSQISGHFVLRFFFCFCFFSWTDNSECDELVFPNSQQDKLKRKF